MIPQRVSLQRSPSHRHTWCGSPWHPGSHVHSKPFRVSRHLALTPQGLRRHSSPPEKNQSTYIYMYFYMVYIYIYISFVNLIFTWIDLPFLQLIFGLPKCPGGQEHCAFRLITRHCALKPQTPCCKHGFVQTPYSLQRLFGSQSSSWWHSSW